MSLSASVKKHTEWGIARTHFCYRMALRTHFHLRRPTITRLEKKTTMHHSHPDPHRAPE